MNATLLWVALGLGLWLLLARTEGVALLGLSWLALVQVHGATQLFGFAGLTIWAVQMLWIPFFAAGVINGLGHYWGYRNWITNEASTNIVPWGILIGGEELHSQR